VTIFFDFSEPPCTTSDCRRRRRCRLLSSEDGRCPMCSEKVKMEEVVELSDVTAILHLQLDAVE